MLWRLRGFEAPDENQKRVECLGYKRYEVDVSDHRPVSASFRVMVRNVDYSAREVVKRRVEERWEAEEARLVGEAKRCLGLDA